MTLSRTSLKLGVVVSPTAPLLPAADLQHRVDRGELCHAVTDAAGVEKLNGLRGLRARGLWAEISPGGFSPN